MTPDPSTILPLLSQCVELGTEESQSGHHLVRVPVLNWERARAVLVRWAEECNESQESTL